MPYKKSRYRHYRRKKPSEIISDTYRTVSIKHTNASTEYPEGTMAVVGKSKKTQNWVIQSVLIPRK